MTPEQWNDLIAATLLAISTGGGVLFAFVQREAIGVILKRVTGALVNTLGKQDTHTNGNGHMTRLNLEGVNVRLETVEEKVKALELKATTAESKAEQLRQEALKREQELEKRVMDAVGEMMNHRLIEPERKLQESVKTLEVLRTDQSQLAQSVMASYDQFQTAFQEFTLIMRADIEERRQERLLRMQAAAPTLPPAPSPELIAAKRGTSEVKSIKPEDAVPDKKTGTDAA